MTIPCLNICVVYIHIGYEMKLVDWRYTDAGVNDECAYRIMRRLATGAVALDGGIGTSFFDKPLQTLQVAATCRPVDAIAIILVSA